MLLCTARRRLFKISAKERDDRMSKSIRTLFFVALLLVIIGGTVMEGATSETKPQSSVIPGEYLVLFKARESIVKLEGHDRAVAVAIMLEMQAEQLTMKYGVSVENTFSAISESSGKGMFFVRSEKAAKDPFFERKLLEEMRADPFIEAVSPNESKKMISIQSKPPKS